MTETAGGSGEAFDPAVVAVDGEPVELTEEQIAAAATAARNDAAARLAAAQSRLAKAKEFLAGAEQAVAEAQAEVERVA